MRRLLLISLFSLLWAAQVNGPIPPEVKFKARYMNPEPKPLEFTSAMLWGIAIADSRVPRHQHARVEIAATRLTCRVDGRDVTLNDDSGNVRGGLYRRHPWFGTDAHNPMPLSSSVDGESVIVAVGARADRVWHFWAASPRAEIPPGRLEGCTVKVRARTSHGTRLQIGFDYWRNATIGYSSGGNNYEAGASNWCLPSREWQEAEFTDSGRNNYSR